MLTLAGIKVIATDLSYNNGNLEADAATLLEEYREDVANISAYATAVQKIEFSFSGTSPDWYDKDFKKRLAECKKRSYTWDVDIYPLLLSAPQTIVNYDKIYQIHSKAIMTDIAAWRQEHCSEFVDNIKDSLNSLKDGVGNEKDLVNELISQLTDYKSNLTDDFKFFKEAKMYASVSERVEADKLKDYEDKIKDLQEEVKRQQDILLGTGISGGVALAAFPVLIYCGPIGIIFGVICLVGGVSLLITAIVASNKIQTLRADIALATENMNKETKYVAELSAWCNDLEKLIDLADSAIKSLSGIGSLWTQLNDNLQEVIDTIEKGEEDATAELMDALEGDVKNADSEWANIVEKAELYSQLNIEISREVVDVA